MDLEVSVVGMRVSLSRTPEHQDSNGNLTWTAFECIRQLTVSLVNHSTYLAEQADDAVIYRLAQCLFLHKTART